MARFRIDDRAVDVEALEARVEASIASKRGKRFTDADLDELRNTPLTPRLRREDLPRGLLGELSSVRRPLPEVPPLPGPEPAPISATREPELDRSPPGSPRPPAFQVSRRGGLAGGVINRLRRWMRPFYKATLYLEPVVDALAQRDDLYLDYLERRLERSADLLKDNLDKRIDRAADWAGGHLSTMTGRLEQRQDRQLHLSHNLVYELTNARLELGRVQDRLDEMSRRVAMLEARERSLEELLLKDK